MANYFTRAFAALLVLASPVLGQQPQIGGTGESYALVNGTEVDAFCNKSKYYTSCIDNRGNKPFQILNRDGKLISYRYGDETFRICSPGDSEGCVPENDENVQETQKRRRNWKKKS